MPEVGVLCPAGNDKIVERNAPPFCDDLFSSGIHIGDFRQDHFRVLLPTKNTANWRRDIARRQTRGRYLIQEWLEQVVIVAIYDGDVEWCSRQLLGGRKTAESSSDNHNARALGCGVNGRHDATCPCSL